MLDFAGGIVVHMTAGVSALVIAWQLGPRPGFPDQVRPPHAPWLVMVGASMLWVGWFGFNAGSALAAGAGAGMAMLVTHLSAAVASLVWMVIEWLRFGKPSVVGLVTGTIAGLATITPASGFVGPVGGIFLGLAGGVLCYLAVQLVEAAMRHRRFARRVRRARRRRRDGHAARRRSSPRPRSAASGLPRASRWRPVRRAARSARSRRCVWSAVASFVLVKITQAVCGLRVSERGSASRVSISPRTARRATTSERRLDLVNWVIAIIQPHRLDAVREALSEVNIHGLTVTEVSGYGRQSGHTEIYRGAEYQISYVPKLKLEIAVDAATLDRVVEAIRAAAQPARSATARSSCST